MTISPKIIAALDQPSVHGWYPTDDDRLVRFDGGLVLVVDQTQERPDLFGWELLRVDQHSQRRLGADSGYGCLLEARRAARHAAQRVRQAWPTLESIATNQPAYSRYAETHVPLD